MHGEKWVKPRLFSTVSYVKCNCLRRYVYSFEKWTVWVQNFFTFFQFFTLEKKWKMRISKTFFFIFSSFPKFQHKENENGRSGRKRRKTWLLKHVCLCWEKRKKGEKIHFKKCGIYTVLFYCIFFLQPFIKSVKNVKEKAFNIYNFTS